MQPASIINRGRGPEIEGTRITVYRVMDFLSMGWHRDLIAVTLRLGLGAWLALRRSRGDAGRATR